MYGVLGHLEVLEEVGRGRGEGREPGLDSSRARSREQEVDTGDRNKEGPLVFTQQVNHITHRHSARQAIINTSGSTTQEASL